MTIQYLINKKVAILGYGIEGQATTKFLLKHGIKPVLFDHKPWKEWTKKEQIAISKLGVDFIFGNDCFKKLMGFEIAFRSPGIPLSHPDLIKWVKPSPQPSSIERGRLKITSQTKFFFENCPAKIIGLTGTKGKGTTASLIYEILQANSYTSVSSSGSKNKLKAKNYLTGNIGEVPPFDIIDKLKPNDWVIFELSSFQLQDLKTSPHIGVVLMVTSEHLDYHGDMKEYINAKNAIVMFQKASDFAIINADFQASLKLGRLGSGKKLYFSRKRGLKQGCFIKDEQFIIKDVLNNNFQFSISDSQLKGEHNLENVCAAILAALCAGANKNTIKTAIKNFKGLEHRLEFVGTKKEIHPVKSGKAGSGQSQKFNGVKFYNDSISTIPETTIAAIKSFNEPIILILGGSSKKSDFTKLAQVIIKAKNIKSIILVGQEAKRIKTAISRAGIFKGKIFTGAKSMKIIFNQIKSIAKKGDTVLLSPACASFDMFKNYKDRGEQFKSLVQLF